MIKAYNIQWENKFTGIKCPRQYCKGDIYVENGLRHCTRCARSWHLDGSEIGHTVVPIYKKEGKRLT